VSRIGKQPVTIPSGVKVSSRKEGASTVVQVEGPKGKLAFPFRGDVSIEVDGTRIKLSRNGEGAFTRAYHGTARALVANMVEGVSKGFGKSLEIVGVGYQAKVAGKALELNIGFCHPVKLPIPQGITVETPKPTIVNISGPDKQVVGQFAAVVRKIRPPEPYKGKGIRYSDEFVIRKAGKTFGSGE
jgi:large subunit ribosomal protein L6